MSSKVVIIPVANGFIHDIQKCSFSAAFRLITVYDINIVNIYAGHVCPTVHLPVHVMKYF